MSASQTYFHAIVAYWGLLAVYDAADDCCSAWITDILAWEEHQYVCALVL